ncbi:SAC3/GANP/Nin1/mts3/eIF-3 p25 family-domain-containing protein [Phycomyces nitens]|nr:SAC3/GANP/Nin1/mts3/eIF-3 p25 family-domain-containing protein [Phycomyces nitens]
MIFMDWSDFMLPIMCSKRTKSANESNVKTISMKRDMNMADIEDTPEEKRRRELRAKRFEDDQPVKQIKPTSLELKVDENGEEYWHGKPVIGTCTNLEKPYLRITSAVNPSTVRPLSILKQAFKYMTVHWNKYKDYTYTCDQMKSIRQDLTVQCIRNKFTVKVYEVHARIALEKGDMGEYNQCQAQLKQLYTLDIRGNRDEFIAYRILYFLFLQNMCDLNDLMKELVGKPERDSPCVQHALGVSKALSMCNYHTFFKLYKSAPNMGGHLMDKFVVRERIKALAMCCKAYKMGISVEFIAQELGFPNSGSCIKFLRGISIHLNRTPEGYMVDTKTGLSILTDQFKISP